MSGYGTDADWHATVKDALAETARERDALREALRDVDTIITDQRLRVISPYVADKVRAALRMADGEGET